MIIQKWMVSEGLNDIRTFSFDLEPITWIHRITIMWQQTLNLLHKHQTNEKKSKNMVPPWTCWKNSFQCEKTKQELVIDKIETKLRGVRVHSSAVNTWLESLQVEWQGVAERFYFCNGLKRNTLPWIWRVGTQHYGVDGSDAEWLPEKVWRSKRMEETNWQIFKRCAHGQKTMG